MQDLRKHLSESSFEFGKAVPNRVFPRSRNERISSGPLELVKCEENNTGCCGLLQLRHSYDNAEMYGANYGYRSGLNASMVSHLQRIALSAQEKISLRPGDLIIDIGSNDATLLKFYPQDRYLLAGIDPTNEKFKDFYPHHIKRIPEFFSASFVKAVWGQKKAKIITSIAMFYDLESPMDFINQVAEVLDDEGVWIFEQSYMPFMIEKNAYDTICHEHLEYYGLKQVKWMLDRAGLKIIDVELNDINGGSFRVSAVKKTSQNKQAHEMADRILQKEQELSTDHFAVFEAFKNRIAAHREHLLDLIGKIKAEKKTILGYGASTKGNVILQYCGITAAEIPFIAEVNEDKFGSFTPGTHIPIISEKEAHAMQPDYFLVLPWHFRDNIIGRERSFLDAGGKLVFPLPEIEIFNE